MNSTPVVTASYTIVSSSAETTDNSSATEALAGPLNFETPIVLSTQPTNDKQANKEHYLTALAASLATLQESINTGLTQRLVQRGILSESTDADPNVNTKLRTKVPGQPNNSKKGQTKKQKLEQKQKEKEQQQQEEEAEAEKEKELSNSSTSTSAQQKQEDVEMQEDVQYRPKGGIYGDDGDEDTTEKDEVDLVMEADPGEVDGACLELPKDQQPQPTQESQTKKRNEISSDNDLASSKKSKGSDK
ncbi:hypothetical protein BGZ76_005718 [Entomortierella beljakovae]|nr:hypothetical protein BGZ76_005718 [Entomortierella beljakovae]